MAGDKTTLGTVARSGTFTFDTTEVNVNAEIAAALNTDEDRIFFVDVMDGDIAFTFGFAADNSEAARFTGTDYGTHKAQCVNNAADLWVLAGATCIISFVAYLTDAN